MSNIYEKISKYATRFLSVKIVFLVDLFCSAFATLLTFLFVNTFSSADSYQQNLFLPCIIASFIATGVFNIIFRYNRLVIRHMSISDMVSFALLALCKIVCVGAVAFIIVLQDKSAYSIRTLSFMLLLDFLLTSGLLVGYRVAMIISYAALRARISGNVVAKHILIYGVSEKSAMALANLASSSSYKVVGFVVNGKGSISGQRVSNLPIFYFEDEDDFKRILSRNSISGILFPTDEDARAEKDGLVKFFAKSGLSVLVVPKIDEVAGGQLKKTVREVKIEDLLGRDEIVISLDKIKSDFEGKTVLITGAAGSIGSELCRQLTNFNVSRLILFDNAETPLHNLRLELEDKYKNLSFIPVIGDIRVPARLDYVFRKWKPQIVFHAAAYKHVPLMEENPCEAVLVNVCGTRNIADKCIEYGAEKMVMISTDKAVNPTNVMGCTKRIAEIYVQSLGIKTKGDNTTKFITTRFGNVLGSNGSVIPRFREQIAAGGPVTVTDPRINRFFMSIPEACRLVMEASSISEGNEICVFDMGEPVLIDDLARRMISLSGFEPDKDIKIEYIGLRPGEKLYEEVLADSENTKPTSHDKIRIASVKQYDYDAAVQLVNDAEDLARKVLIPQLVEYMHEAVPEYARPINGKF